MRLFGSPGSAWSFHHREAVSARPACLKIVGREFDPRASDRGTALVRCSRLGAGLAAWGALTGIAPHVLHHVGPLAGAALLAGTGGRLLFTSIALAVSIPFLLGIYHRFRTWMAPAIALAVMAAMCSLSTFVIGPAISAGDNSSPQTEVERPGLDDHGH
jgi:hypothetical protein